MTGWDNSDRTTWKDDESICKTAQALTDALAGVENLTFREALRISGLSPKTDLRYGDWSGLCLDGEDLSGCDFTGADLRGCTFVGARIAGAQLEGADIDPNALMKALDYASSRGGRDAQTQERARAKTRSTERRSMDFVLSPLDLVGRDPLSGPVAIARPHRVRAAAEWFLTNFPGETFYSVKANPSPWVLDALYEIGLRRFAATSEGEIELIASRFPEAQIVFMHPVKSRRSIGRAFHEFGVRTFAVDGEDELEKVLGETNHAKDLTLFVRLAISGDGSAYPLTRKFGASPENAPVLLRKARQASEENLGVSFHVGSQCMRPVAFRDAMNMVNHAIVSAGVVADIVNVGGGFPAIYPGMTPPAMIDYVKAIRTSFDAMFVAHNAQLWAEPGRALVAEAGSTVARVELRKGDALYLNDGAFGTLFDATHLNWSFPAKLLRLEPSRAKLAPFRLYGPTCDSMDAAAGPFMLPADIQEGDLIEIGSLGAYGTTMGTRFNGFGETVTIESKDAPWPTMYGEAQAALVAMTPERSERISGKKPE